MRKKYDAAPPPPTAAECSRFLQLTGFGGKLFLRVNIVPASFVFPNIFTFFLYARASQYPIAFLIT